MSITERTFIRILPGEQELIDFSAALTRHRIDSISLGVQNGDEYMTVHRKLGDLIEGLVEYWKRANEQAGDEDNEDAK